VLEALRLINATLTRPIPLTRVLAWSALRRENASRACRLGGQM
jgi:hypothetical protein